MEINKDLLKAVLAHPVKTINDVRKTFGLLEQEARRYLFVAENIDITLLDSTTVEETVEVYVGGTRVTSGFAITGDSPVTVAFTDPKHLEENIN